MPSLDTLNKPAFLYRCSAGDLLDGQDHSLLDLAPPPGAAAPERPAEPSPAAAVPPPAVAGGTAHPAVPLPDPAAVVAAVRPLPVAGPVAHHLNPDRQRLAAAVGAPSRVDATVVEHLEQVLSYCVRRDDALGPRAVLDTVLAQRRLVAGLLTECPPALRPRLLALYADQSRVLGWPHYDLNDFDGAAAYYEHARAAAHEAQDPALGAQILCYLSQLATWRQRPRVGVDHAVAAQHWAARTDDPLLRAWVADMAACAYARDGQERACLAELDTAGAGVAVVTGWSPRVHDGYDEGCHAGIRGKCLLQLHRVSDAVLATERSLAALDRTYVRDVAFATVDLGLARLECGDPDHAAATLAQAADLAVRNRSARLAGEIQAARARMQPWQDSRAVTQLDERLRTYRLV